MTKYGLRQPSNKKATDPIIDEKGKDGIPERTQNHRVDEETERPF
jgi:hypothetical protein